MAKKDKPAPQEAPSTSSEETSIQPESTSASEAAPAAPLDETASNDYILREPVVARRLTGREDIRLGERIVQCNAGDFLVCGPTGTRMVKAELFRELAKTP